MKPPNRLLWPIGALVVLVAAIAVRNSVAWYGRPVPGLLVDVSGSISAIGLPAWRGAKLKPQYPQQISPEGEVLREEASNRRVLGIAPLRGCRPAGCCTHTSMVRTAEEGDQPAGASTRAAGMVALWRGTHPRRAALRCRRPTRSVGQPEGRLARTFAIFSINFGFFLLALFDVHTQRSLSHVFFWSFALMPWTLVMLILRLPDDASVLRRFPKLEPVGHFVGACLAATCSIVYETGGSTQRFQALFSSILILAGLVFTATFAARYWRARAERRKAYCHCCPSMAPPSRDQARSACCSTWQAGAMRKA